jgi:dihydroorotase-like cyclic amidohydrolase
MASEASAADASRATGGSARLVMMIGTRPPTTTPAAQADWK